MKRAILFAATAIVAMLFALTLGVQAQQPDTKDRTIMTFSNAVELPGMKLEAGTYVFKLADTASRNVIQVFDQDEKMIMGQWLFVPAERQEVTGDTVVTFKETSAGATPAVQYWYYPGEKIGKEFIYPKDQALRIAGRTGATVLTEEGPVTSGSQTASASVETDTNKPASVEASASAQTSPAENPSAQTSPAEKQRAVAVGTSGSDQSQNQSGASNDNANRADNRPAPTAGAGGNARQESTVASRELPRTASPLPLSGLISFLSLGGAAVVRRFRL
jgi:hypothetical protein